VPRKGTKGRLTGKKKHHTIKKINFRTWNSRRSPSGDLGEAEGKSLKGRTNRPEPSNVGGKRKSTSKRSLKGGRKQSQAGLTTYTVPPEKVQTAGTKKRDRSPTKRVGGS